MILVRVVTISSGELRAYVGLNTNKATLWCINLSQVITDRVALNANAAPDPGDNYLCGGAFPKSLSPTGFGPRSLVG